ncbi:MAG TPA: DUF4350 domain-containing protein [Pyrinomonadaceae bacterium]|nr:DUF4350 domain-containing protein [Pyrinomonadaceae bacterium]
MRQRLTIILTFAVIIGVLILVSTFSYVQKSKEVDYEVAPNRSTYHSGPTGVRALYDFLSESGYKVVRWKETPQKLLTDSGKAIKTFVITGDIKVRFTNAETEALLKWIQAGGHLVVIDRNPQQDRTAAKPGSWNIRPRTFQTPTIETDPANPQQMTENVVALKPAQPTLLTRNVESVMPSCFAARLSVDPVTALDAVTVDASEPEEEPAPEDTTVVAPAPVVHMFDDKGALLVDFKYDSGRVILLTDPYMISNSGIKLNDNLQLATNILTTADGLIAFDEYHQGKGRTQNTFAGYFAGTPVLLLAAQIGFVVVLILWGRGSRFGRPLPLSQVDRRSSLEFVASMAELQQRARAFDLAIENIYTRTRRVLARHAGVDYNSSRAEIASRIASRGTIDGPKLESLMRECEGVINGEPCSWRQSIDLVRRLREVERDLGLRMRSREERQAAENI